MVSSFLPDLEPFRPWVMFYDDGKEMEEAIEKSLKEDSREKAQERRRIASENTWDQRVKTMVEIFDSVFIKWQLITANTKFIKQIMTKHDVQIPTGVTLGTDFPVVWLLNTGAFGIWVNLDMIGILF